MRDPERIDRVLGLIKEIWMKHPDLRYTQLQNHLVNKYSDNNEDAGKQYFYDKHEFDSGNVIQFKKEFVRVDLFYLEDDKFEEFLEEFLMELSI